MADKKITELTELSPGKQGDILPIVDNPTGTPITKKITLANLFGNVGYVTPSTDATIAPIAGLKVTTTANIVFTVASSTVTGATISANALVTSTNTSYQYGILGTSRLDGATANVKVEHAAGKFLVDVSNAASLIANTYGVVIEFANTGVRVANTQAFLALAEASTSSFTNSTVYLLETKNITSNLAVASGNISVMFSNTAVVSPTHKLRVRINGVNYFLLAAREGAAGI